MRSEKNQKQTRLKTWLFTKPLMFAFMCMVLGILFGLIYALIQTFLNFESLIPMYILATLTFILPVCYLIKKLPHEKISQSDFVAITNGAGMISFITSFFVVIIFGLYTPAIKRAFMMFNFSHPILSNILQTTIIFFVIYLIGVAVVSIYAKYKRAVTIGISPLKVILSMPFAFLLMWAPGYLIKNQETKSNLEIKSNWYTQFNKWVLSNFNNTLFVFLVLIFCKCTFTTVPALPVLILSALLLIIYTLWYVKHKPDFIKKINEGYALTAICINIAILIAVVVSLVQVYKNILIA